jgi:hypothetical protein
MRHDLTKPIQTVSYKEKTNEGETGKQWRKLNVDYHIDKATYVNDFNSKFESLYKKAAGHITEEDYNYLLNPYGKHSKLQYNLKIRNYDIISPLIQMLMGEKSRRKSDPIVVAINSDIVNVKEEQLKQLINEELDQVFINELNSYVETGFISRDVKGYENLKTKVDSIKDTRAIVGQQALSYIYYTEDVKRKLRESFYDFLVTGYGFSKKDVHFNNIIYKTYSAINTGYTCSENTRFIEDGESAFVKEYMTVSDIIDEFNDELSDVEVKRLESIDRGDHSNNDHPMYLNSDVISLYDTLKENGSLHRLFNTSKLHNNKGLIEVCYVNWKSKIKIGKVSGVDAFGNPYEVEVDETYKLSPNETIEWKWVNQVWEGYRIAKEIYKRVRPIPFQRGNFDNPSKCKLLINGVSTFSRHFMTKSCVEKIEPHQIKYNVLHWHLEKVLNKNKDKLTILPKGLIPDDDDMDMFDMLYYADADGFLFVDEVDDRRLQELQAIRVLDLSLKDYLQQLWTGLEWTRSEAEDTLGINRQRKGQTFASDGKGMNEQAIFQSSIISEEVFLEFEEFEEKEYQGLLDLSKFAWLEGKKAWFVDSDQRRTLLEIQGREHNEMEYSIKVMNGREKNEKLDRIRANTQAFIQNAVKPSIVTKMETVDNIEELIDYLEETESNLEKQQQAAQQAEQEMEAARLEQVERHHADKIAMEKYKVDADIYKSMNIGASMDKNPDNDIQRQELDIKRKDLEIKSKAIEANILINREKN